MKIYIIRLFIGFIISEAVCCIGARLLIRIERFQVGHDRLL